MEKIMIGSAETATVSAKSHSTARLMPLIILVMLSIIWGMAFVAIKYTEPFLDPVNLTLLRWFIAGAALLFLAPFLGRMRARFQIRDLPRFALVSFANVVAYHLTLNYSESSISAGLAVLLVAMGPVFILVLSWVFLEERHGKRVIIAVTVAFAGALILSFGNGVTAGSSSFSGILEAVGTALSYSAFAVFSKPLVRKYGAIPFTIWVGLFGTVMLLPLVSGSFISQVSALPLDGWISMLYLSLASTVLGYMIFYTLVNRGSVSRLAVQLYLVPLVGVIGGVLILGESISVYTIEGGIAILVAVAISTGNMRMNMTLKKPE